MSPVTTLMKKLTLAAAGAVAIGIGFYTSKAEASLIVLNDSAPQAIAGQDFNFNFSPVTPSNGLDGIFTIRARGDYSIGFPAFESLSIDIDGIFSQSQVTATPANVITEFSFNNVLWEQNFTISGLDLLSITQDSLVNISVDLLPGVDIGFGTAFVEVTLEYEEARSVPEPASLLGLLALGTLGTVSALKRKRKDSLPQTRRLFVRG